MTPKRLANFTDNDYAYYHREIAMEVSKRALSAKERGRKGGIATAENHNSSFLQLRSKLAGSSTRDKYGNGYYRHIRNNRPKVKSPKEKIIQEIIPNATSIPENTVQLMQAVAKTLA